MTRYNGKCHWNTWVHKQLLRVILEATDPKVTEINQGRLPEALPGGCPRSLVGILKCLVSAFCQGYTTLSEI